jgi:hypothetical protein
VQSAPGERLPPDGTPGGPGASALHTKAIDSGDWERALAERLKPACDARPGSRRTDIPNLEAAGKIIGTWMDFSQKAKAGSRTSGANKIGGDREPTRVVASVGLTCSPQRNTVQVNGVEYPFDLAWVVSGQGAGRTLSGNEGPGHFAMIQAISFKEKRVVFAKVYVPSDANDDTDDTVVIGNLAGYLPDDPDEPIVRAVSDRDSPQLETFVFAKGAKQGLSLLVPQQGAVGRARYLSVGKFEVTAVTGTSPAAR